MLVVIVLILILLKLWDMWDESSKAECKRIGKKRAREKMQKDQDEKAKEVQRKLVCFRLIPFTFRDSNVFAERKE